MLTLKKDAIRNARNIVFWNGVTWNVVNHKGLNSYNYTQLVKRATVEFTKANTYSDENNPGRHGGNYNYNVSVEETNKALAKATKLTNMDAKRRNMES